MPTRREPAAPVVVSALAVVGVESLRTGAGVGLPVSAQTVYKQMAAYLVDRYLRGTRPSPSNTHLQQMADFIRTRLLAATPSVTARKTQLRALAALALGHVTDFTPPVARAAAAVRIAEPVGAIMRRTVT